MQDDVIQFHGSYRYPDRKALERAITAARTEIGKARDHTSLRCFVTHETFLTVNLSVNASEEQRLAANIFLLLAHGALEGTIDHSREAFSDSD